MDVNSELHIGNPHNPWLIWTENMSLKVKQLLRGELLPITNNVSKH